MAAAAARALRETASGFGNVRTEFADCVRPQILWFCASNERVRSSPFALSKGSSLPDRLPRSFRQAQRERTLRFRSSGLAELEPIALEFAQLSKPDQARGRA